MFKNGSSVHPEALLEVGPMRLLLATIVHLKKITVTPCRNVTADDLLFLYCRTKIGESLIGILPPTTAWMMPSVVWYWLAVVL